MYEIAKNVKGPTISALARVTKGDIDAAYESLKPAADRGDGMLHLFIGTSECTEPTATEKTLKRSKRWLEDAVEYAKKFFGDVQFSPEDATRTDPEYLDFIIETAISAGATRINIPDTVGYAIINEFPD